ncbi:hypothetical protein AB0E62_00275 [Streptomyces sp. NPDC038707]|uniref:hypothetical protein n=1 Tax=Streptomyces sp. NPDC038707 TaxID=3154329 RepID=UPI00340FD6BA
MNEETVKVDLGDDFYQGAYFSTTATYLDYEVPKSQLERWEAAKTAYEAMQAEICRVMEEQGNRVLALHMERRKGQPSSVLPAIQVAYEDAIARMLEQSQLLRKEQPE